MADKKSFILYYDYKKYFDKLSNEDKGKLIDAIFCDGTSDLPQILSDAADMAFSFIIDKIHRDNQLYEETCAKRRVSGSMGGRPKNEESKENNCNTDETKRLSEKAKKANGYLENQSKAKKPDTDTEIDTDTVTDTENETETDIIKREKPTRKETKKVYGSFENVKLTDSEYSKLISDYPNITDDYIERVSTYIAQKGDKYKSHYATILTWIRRDGETAASQPKQVCGNPFLQLLKDEGVYE